MIDTTLMMVTYNRLDLTKETVRGLLSGNAGRDFNLVIVDNGSEDGTIQYLQEIDGTNNISVKYLPKNKGIAVGRNIALKMADDLGTQWYCTIDNDVLLPDMWLHDCVSILEANKSFAAIGANFEDTDFPVVTKNGFTFQEKHQGNLGTACMVFRKQLHQMIGFFTTEYGLYGLEDSDYGMRCRVAGFKLGYLKERGTHLGIGEQDQGEYREFKTETHNNYLSKFNANCGAYVRRERQLYIPYKED